MKKRNKLTVLFVIGVVIMAILIGSGCTSINPFDKKPIRLDEPIFSKHKYYVIDANADIPDAFFETFNEAASYQKEFAANHEYVIVKIDENMEPIKNDTQTVQKNQ